MNSYYAIRFDIEFATGTNAPVLVGAVDQEGNQGDFVVKLRAGKRMYELAFMDRKSGDY